MNESIIKEIYINLNIKEYQVKNVLELLEGGNTIPFIARYRKEATGGLDEVLIKEINDVYMYQKNLLKRKEDVIRLIDEKGMLTDEIKNNILSCSKLVEIEDIYRPYMEKKKTKATIAIANGLEGLAQEITKFPLGVTVEELAKNYVCEKVTDIKERLSGARDIIAEWISDDAEVRKWIRRFVSLNGDIISKLKKNAVDDKKVYEMYYEHKERLDKIKPHRILALNRGEKDNVLNVSIDVSYDNIFNYLKKRFISNDQSLVVSFIEDAINDSYKRLIFPSIEREIRSDLKDIANEVAIDNFATNVSSLLMTPPMKEITVLGFDPAFRTGCKLAVLDKRGNVLDICVIYPHEPKNEIEKSKTKILDLINKYEIDVIAIGNGTASRESEKFIVDTLKECKRDTKYIIVSEAGASVYSASDMAISEFPDLDVSERSAISIGRRLQDPLSELVKIDPKSIGVGLYQHDVKEKELDDSLTFVVSNVVNKIGVNINTASLAILSYISGLNKKTIEAIFKKKTELGKFKTREDLKKIKGLSTKVYEQAIGFLRVYDGINPLDKTNIHPESYVSVYKILELVNCALEDLGTEKLTKAIDSLNKEELRLILNIDMFTLEDIISSLNKPLFDPRDSLDKPLLKSDILSIDNLKKGIKLQGTVRNIVDFGAFVDIGIKNDGLIHISQITDKYIKHPNEFLHVGDIIDCFVLEVNTDKQKVSLTLLEKNI